MAGCLAALGSVGQAPAPCTPERRSRQHAGCCRSPPQRSCYAQRRGRRAHARHAAPHPVAREASPRHRRAAPCLAQRGGTRTPPS
eukprot:4522575-Pleurochrysis_carterae.AAC.4